jgi:hypothetical protein
MYNEMERVKKEVAMSYSIYYYSSIHLELRMAMKSLSVNKWCLS